MKRIFQRFSKNGRATPQPSTEKAERKRVFDKSLLTVTTSLGSLRFVPLAIPIFLELIFNHLLGTVSTVVLSGYSDEAVVATGSVNIVFSLCVQLFAGMSTGASVIISNYIGAERLSDAKKAGGTAVLFLGMIGLGFAGMLLLSAPLLVRWMNLTGLVREYAIAYMRIRAIALIFAALTNVLLATMRCYGFPRYTVMIGIVKNICNLLCSTYAVYYAKIPELSGVRGVALGHIASECISLAIVIFFFARLKLGTSRPESGRAFLGTAKKILAIGIPTCVSSTGYTLSQIVTNSFAQLLPWPAPAAKIYCANILSYAYLFSSGCGHANALMAGRLYGAGRYEHADRLNKMLAHFTVPVNLLVSLGILLLRVPLLSMFTDEKEIFAIAIGVFLVDILIEQARAFSHIYEYSLRSTGDVMPTMVTTLISCWVFSVAFAYILGIHLGLGLIGFYIGLACDEWVRALFTFFRWKYRIAVLQGKKTPKIRKQTA